MSTESKNQKRTSCTTKSNGEVARMRSANAGGMGASLFEVSAEDVASLKDDELRELVARLCKATLAEARLPTTRVTWGGDQREQDGGIDVRVQLHDKDPLPDSSWLHWRTVGFQVKATKMGPKAIKEEMGVKESLKPSIREVLQSEGAYIIAANDSVADKFLNERISAMQECAANLLQHGHPSFVGYYDRRRLADWVNEYPAVVTWVHYKIKDGTLHGWEPYGQWATSKRMSDGKYPPFIPDEKARFVDPRDPERGLNLIEGIERVREFLRKASERTGEEDGRAVRLVGLSGVGKTRFVQALFEANVGSEALDQELAVYADAGRTLNPAPAIVLDRLISSRKRTVLIIDNCDPKLHRELVEKLGKVEATARVSLLTVEYDIRNETPYETQVFRLENGSVDLVQKIVIEQFPGISRVDVRTIAKFSDGNSRVAIALASAVGQTGSLAGLSDEELLDRLFRQRNEPNDALERAAKACSLVYSFDGGDQEQESEELKLLAGLAGMDVQELYEHLADLRERGLIQERGRWRAVLPQAIANRLAVRALERIHIVHIEQRIDDLASKMSDWRMLRSFSRRLGYLHESAQAKNIVRKWLQPGGRLGQPDEKIGWSLYAELLANVAPVDQQGTLSVIEHLISLDQTRSVIESGVNNSGLRLTGDDIDEGRVRLLALLRLLAYDASLFDRCLDVLLKFAVVEKDPQGSAGRIAESLFLVTLSGTLAKTDQRLRWLEKRLRSDDESVRSIACGCLWKALKSRAFRSEYNFDFGARKRDFGWKPTDEEKEDWYVRFIDLSVKAVEESLLVAPGIKDVLARRFRELWAVAIKAGGVKDSLSRAVMSFAQSGCEDGWQEGWVAIRETIFFDGKKMTEEDRNVLKELEEVASPRSPMSLLRVLLLDNHLGIVFSDASDSSEREGDAVELAKEFGKDLAKSEPLSPKAMRLVTEGGRHGDSAVQYALGKSMAVHAPDGEKIWDALLEGFESWSEVERDATVLKGYLEGVFERDVMLFNRLLDGAMRRPSLVRYVPSLQSCAPLDDLGRDRLLALMNLPGVCAEDFEYGWGGRAGEPLPDGSYPDERVASVLLGLLWMKGGSFVAIQVLSQYVFKRNSRVDRCLSEVAYKVLEAVLLGMKDDNVELGRFDGLVYPVKRVIKFFLGPSAGVDVEDREIRTRHIMQCLMDEVGPRLIFLVPGFNKILGAFFGVQGKVALDFLVGDDGGVGAECRRFNLRQGGLYGDGDNPLIDLSLDDLLQWCRSKGSDCWIHAANAIPVILPVTEGWGESRWQWSPLAVALLDNAPNPCQVAEALVKRIHPDSLAGVTSQLLRERLPLLDRLSGMLGSECSEKMEGWRKELQHVIDEKRRREEQEAQQEAPRQKEQARFE